MGKSSTTTQTNKPPEWSEPLLETAASDAMNLYNSGTGYNVYKGPTQAGFSDPSLSAMNSLMAATGYTGAPLSNQTWQSNPAIQQARNLLQRQSMGQSQQQPTQAAAATPYESQKGEIQGQNGSVFYNGINYYPVGDPVNGQQKYSGGGKYLTLKV